MTDAPATQKTMNEPGHCAQCGAPLPSDIAGGICPKCELRGALNLPTDATQIASGPLTQAGESSSLATVTHPEGGEVPGVFPSKRFGDYELLEEIAQGGMGIVYKARQMSLNRMVAVKMILAGQFATTQIAQRFRGEAAAVGTLQHPNIVAIHEIGMHEGRHFFSMDYVEGQNLTQLVGIQPLPPPKAAGYVKVIAEAIHYAHQQGILHRDLKPSNVLIDAATDQPRVTDFGLAKRLDGESSITVTGQVLGSPNFMPPEQASGSRGKVGRHSDVYGLGAILFYTLTARAPFQGATLETTIHEVLNTEPLSPRALNPSVPLDLETICLKCLEKEPARRYQTAHDLEEELDRFLRDEPILARPVSQTERVWRWCRRKPALAGSLAAAAILLLIVIIGSPIAAVRINREARRAEAGETAFRLSAYTADMNVAQAALQEHNLARALRSLERWIPSNAVSPSGQSTTPTDLRGWEWRYLWSQCRSDERATLTRPEARHSGFIVSVAYSPDGKWLVSGSHDGRVKLFDLLTRREVAELPHKKEVRAVAFSPRDSTLATLCADGFLRFWDAKTHANLGTVPADASLWSGAVAFSQDGTYLAFSTPDSVTISNLTLRTSLVIKAGNTALAFFPDGTVLATRAYDGLMQLWDVVTGQLKHVLSHFDIGYGMCTVAFSPDGHQLVSTSIDQTWKLWDTESGRLLHTEKSRFGHPVAALFLNDGKTIAVANAYTISLWHPTAEGWKEQAVLKGHKQEVWALALSPDGTELASGSTDGEVKLWSRTAPSAPSDWMPAPANARAFFSTDARAFLFAFTNGTIEIWDSSTLTKTTPLIWPETNTSAFALYSDGKFIASGGNDGSVKLWRVAGRSLQEERRFKLDAHVTYLAFSPNGKSVAAASDWGKMMILFDVESGQKLLELEGAFSVKFSPDSTLLVSTHEDGKVKLWQLSSGRRVWTSEHERTSTDAAFFPGGRWIVTGAWETKARMWDAASGRELAVFQGQLQGAHSVDVSPDGRRVAIGADEGVVKLFLLDGSQQPLDVLTLPCLQNWVERVAFLPDGETIVAACREGIQVWHAPSFAELASKENKEHAK